jgi:uncharacterized protein (TIGR03067 family)
MQLPVTFTAIVISALIVHADDKKPTPDKPAPGNSDKPAAGEPAKPAGETPKPDGVWKPASGSMGGVAMPEAMLKAITLKITGTNYEVIVAGESTEKDKGTCTLDTSVTPHRITIKSTEGPNKGKTILAIAEMPDANSMRVCYDLGGKEFPKKFESLADTQLFLVTYQREKK